MPDLNTPLSAPPISVRPTSVRARLIGIDIARFIAILGMVTEHVWPRVPGEPWSIRDLAAGNASTLFAVLGGVSIILATQSAVDRGHPRGAYRSLIARSLAIIVIGLTLGLLPAPAINVLVYFGVAMLFAVPFLRAPSWLIGTAVAVLAVGGGILTAWSRIGMDALQEYASISWLDLGQPLSALRGVLVTGTYPVVTWLTYLLIGMLVGRSLLRQRTARTPITIASIGLLAAAAAMIIATALYTLVGRDALLALTPGLARQLPPGFTVDAVFRSAGMGAAAFRWPDLLLDSPHTGTLFDIGRGAGVALLVIGITTLLSKPLSVPVLAPIRRAGAAPLTSYTFHLIVLTVLLVAAGTGQDTTWTYGPVAFGANLGAILVVGGCLALLRRRGPLETLVSAVSRSAAGGGRRREDVSLKPHR
ncbi:heparan-alpha-glucosaminide N-acetyltransferase domain-containing protein [Plantibacter sp. ME-Dv--P-122b]|uniref:heparan-alpha-glucosaminide N-acetyltransferase domain-containing protein n=1 Tax=Plantibacter sp. ME-Dv--P-122b TaxID=3040300 RepID=UPI00254D9DF0|nr:heparan-alpha-glucosaminide N-acetyltransferase domain-containing protein [Plantibacter sp. ME-Dv--P-122b]